MVQRIGRCPKCLIGRFWPDGPEFYCWSCGIRAYLMDGCWQTSLPAPKRVRGSAHNGEGYGKYDGTYPDYYPQRGENEHLTIAAP